MAQRPASWRSVVLLVAVLLALLVVAGIPTSALGGGPGGAGDDPIPGGAESGWHPLPVWVAVLSVFYVFLLP